MSDNGFTPGITAIVGGPNDTEVLGLKAGLEELIDGHVDEPMVEGPPTETDAPDTDVLRVEVETPSRWYQRLIDHPWFITIVGGIIVLVLGILIFGN